MRDFRDIIELATAEHAPSKRFVLFSGGNDSTALLHMVWHAGLADAAVHIETGIGIPETRAFVDSICARYNIPLLVYKPREGRTYRDLVLKYGFPGPGAHSLPYRWLKELQVDRLVSDYKKKWNDRIMLITGVRLAESNRRMGNVVEVKRDGCQLWVSPILDWTKDDLREYRRAHNVPESEVAALLHMSGECLCGAFAHKDEIKDLHAFYPETAHRIHKLEREVEAAGQARCVWGTGKVRKSKGGILCVGCEAAQL